VADHELLPVGLPDSHQDGGRVFVIYVADPRTRESYTIAGGGTVLEVMRRRRVAATVVDAASRDGDLRHDDLTKT
jgi:hypothetical protein